MTDDKSYLEFSLMTRPYKVTVGQVKEWLDRKDKKAKAELIQVIFHRLHRRYIVPLAHVRKKLASDN
jgi:hypothetical protein